MGMSVRHVVEHDSLVLEMFIDGNSFGPVFDRTITVRVRPPLLPEVYARVGAAPACGSIA